MSDLETYIRQSSATMEHESATSTLFRFVVPATHDLAKTFQISAKMRGAVINPVGISKHYYTSILPVNLTKNYHHIRYFNERNAHMMR